MKNGILLADDVVHASHVIGYRTVGLLEADGV